MIYSTPVRVSHEPISFRRAGAWRVARAALVIFCLSIAGRAGAGVMDPRLERKLTAAGGAPVSVIVTLADAAPTLPAKPPARGAMRAKFAEELRTAAARQRQPLEDWLRQKGVTAIKPLWVINGFSVSAPPAVIRALASFPGVTSVRPNGTVRAPRPPLVSAKPLAAKPLSAPIEWNVSGIKAPDLWAKNYTGTGIVVGSLDTGVDYRHSDLSGRWRGGSNSWFDPYGQHGTPYDAANHGTAVMGVMVGGSATGSSVGVAPGAKWICAKIFDDAGNGEFAKIHESFAWMLDPDGNSRTDDAPDIVNNSWGLENIPGEYNTEFLADVRALKAAGIGVVIAAGNSGSLPATSLSPANYPQVLSVGNVDLTGSTYYVVSSSSRGPSAAPGGGLFPLVVAPGEGVRSCGTTGGINLTAAVLGSGTSFSSPAVAGGMALLAQAFPKAKMAQIEGALAQTATDLGIQGIDNVCGYGMINLLAAYNLLRKTFSTGADPAWIR